MTKEILVVDDEIYMERLFRLFFEEEIETQQYELIFAYDGEEALIKLSQNNDINLVLTDINMPVKDGFELISDMRNNNFQQPVIVISAYDLDSYRDKAMNLGAAKYLIKPINFENLKEVIKTII